MDNEVNQGIPESRIIDVDLDKEMRKSFLDYSMSVIVSRALPDVRDGLKPVHRRILYAKYENNILPTSPYKKCATTVGDVLGKYHPHGDASVYDALVRLAQDFSMRYMLVDGHGNFGSVDGDPPAAYRYTESRMSKISVEMLRDIDKDTVDFVPNYDDSRTEPSVLPTKFPNLLVNGSTGIAVGMATNIPPHNLSEVSDAICYLVDNPDAELAEIMDFIKGPDFPTGGIIMGRSGIRAAYATGKGKINVRAKTEIVEAKNGRHKIIVTELPYQVNKAKLIESIADYVKDKKIEGITNIEDHSDRNGMHIEIDVKREVDPNIVLNNLFKLTQMQSTFGVIMIAIVNGEPKLLRLKDILEKYIEFQIEIITRRSLFELKKAKDRLHILEGLKIALDFIDEVIAIIRASKDQASAKQALSARFGLDDVQTQAIVDMRLGRLTNLERNKIEEEIASLNDKITDLNEIIESETRKRTIIKEEITEIRNKYGDERRTEICEIDGELDDEELIPREDCVLTLTNLGYIKRLTVDTYKLQKRGGKGITGVGKREEEVATDMFVINSHDYVMFFTNLGKVYRIKCYRIHEGSRTSKGMHIANILPLEKDEHVSSMIRVPSFEEEKESYLVMITNQGYIKRVELSLFSNIRKGGMRALELNEGDELSWVRLTDGKQQMLVATKLGKAIRFDERDVRAMGRTARGVHAIRLSEGDSVIGMSILREGGYVLTVSEKGFGRLSNIDDYRIQSRGGSGIINYHTSRFGNVAAIKVVDLDDDIILISDNGTIIRIIASSIRICARPSKGVTVMKVAEGSKVVSLARTPHEESDDEQQDNTQAESEENKQEISTEKENNVENSDTQE
ncbi:MAG: DNA gyrase subunit A [Clostridia bacterium]|nr:DNA gyrase subunit A [Clostridia bacterium]